MKLNKYIYILVGLLMIQYNAVAYNYHATGVIIIENKSDADILTEVTSTTFAGHHISSRTPFKKKYVIKAYTSMEVTAIFQFESSKKCLSVLHKAIITTSNADFNEEIFGNLSGMWIPNANDTPPVFTITENLKTKFSSSNGASDSFVNLWEERNSTMSIDREMVSIKAAINRKANENSLSQLV